MIQMIKKAHTKGG